MSLTGIFTAQQRRDKILLHLPAVTAPAEVGISFNLLALPPQYLAQLIQGSFALLRIGRLQRLGPSLGFATKQVIQCFTQRITLSHSKSRKVPAAIFTAQHF
jgi:hypothetical protein